MQLYKEYTKIIRELQSQRQVHDAETDWTNETK